ncbi:MAG: hypothetical protein P4L30_01555, partial [Candidatus Limnocylindrales bacterium]|nr:hypothetical protein [Candidatus Limnocylindrales bacterium]
MPPIMPLVAVLSTLLSLLFLTALAAPGIAALDRFARWLTPLERFAYGAVLGMVAGTLALVPAATVLGFTPPVVLGTGVVSAVVAALLVVGPGADRRRPGAPVALRDRLRDLVGRLDPWATGLVALLTVRWALLWSSALTVRADGLWAGHEYIWSDWPTHLGIVTRFAFGGNFPPENTLFAGLPLSYHYLSDLTPAAFVVLGMDPLSVLPLHSFVLSILVALGLYAFARRLSGVHSIATLAVILFLFGAGLGWIATVARIDSSHDLLGTLINAPWDAQAQGTLNIHFFNPYLAFLMSQRAYLYGLPLAMLVVTLLVRAARRNALPTFALAGVVAGLLPLAHLPTLLALAMVTPFLVFLLARRPWHLEEIPWRGWIGFHLIWVAVAVPQLLTQLGGGAGALAAFRLDIGWVAAPDPWWWFWLKNLGLFIPLGLLALGARRILPPRSHRALLAFMPIFVAANLFAFQPWNWDNHKILIYWFLALTILVAALLVRAWRSTRSATVRLLLIGVVLTMTLGPLLENLGQLEGHGQYLMLTTEQLQIAAEIREVTDPKALIVGGMQPQDPVMELTGRRLLMGYWGQLWVSG